MKRHSSLLAVVLVMLLAAGSVLAGTQTRATPTSPLLWWPAGSVVNYSFTPGTIAPGNDNDLVRAAVKSAFTTLMDGLPKQNGKPVVQFFEASATSGSVNKIACDGVSLVTFTDNSAEDRLDPSIVAQATMWSSPAKQSNVQDPCSGKTVSWEAGQIYEVDMNFNFEKAFTANRIGLDGHGNPLYDIQSVATHEGGHWLGLGHTGIASAVMSPYGDSGGFPVRSLHSDDLASMIAVYAPGGPTISGQVTRGGSPVKGAHVVATNAATGLTAASALSDANGNYKIYGLTAGQSYKVFGEPLDGPVFLGNMPPGWESGSASFVTAFANSGGGIPVGSGDTSANITVGLAGPTTPNLLYLGLVTGSGGTFTASYSTVPISVPRGTRTTIIALGSAITENSALPTFSSPNMTVAGSSVLFIGALSADLTVGATAPLGPVDVYLGGSSFTGGIIVTTRPSVPSNGIVNGAAFNVGVSPPHYAPGSMISIFGTDFALSGTVVNAAEIPIPTELGGVSVKIGNQLAPIFGVYDVGWGFQINAMIPYELTPAQMASGVDVVVKTGSNSESAPVHISVASSAPRIFMLDAAKQVGAIIKYLVANGQVVGSVIVFEGTAVRASDYIEVYGHGLGPATGAGNKAAVTGMAYPGATFNANDTPTVTIGGIPATVIYAGTSPCCAGLNQIDVQVPAGIQAGLRDLVVSTKSGASNIVKILVQ